jgi:branched-chain amino acid transport system permease protein
MIAWLRSPVGLWSAAALVVLLFMPAILPELMPLNQANFWLGNIFGRGIIFGIIAMSLTFLATYGGFVSLAQMSVAGVAGYVLAVTIEGAAPSIVGGLGYFVAIPLAIFAAVLAALFVGLVSVRTRDIYLLMITLALAMGFFRFVETNIAWFNGYEGIRNILGPSVFGLPFRDPLVIYYVTLIVAVSLYAGVLYLVRSPFGLVLQGIRDNPRRIAALGYNVALHRVAAFGVAGFIAGCGGVLMTIYNFGISPGTVGLGATVNVLIMSVIGGLGHPIGAFIGSLIFAFFDTFAATIYDRNRFNTLIGVVFLIIVLVSPDGVIGFAKRAYAYMKSKSVPKTWAKPGSKPG